MVGGDVSQETIERFREDLLGWSESNLREFPWRDPERSPYEVMIAEILLQRTRADNVVPIYEEFLKRYPDFDALTRSSTEEVAELLQPLGLQNRRAESLLDIASQIDGTAIPETREELMELPHVGLYVSGATLSFGFDRPAAIVDSNVMRVYERVFDIEEKRPRNDELWAFAERVLPDDHHRQYNLAILDFGALICTASSPRCEECFARSYCSFYQDGKEQPR